MAAKVQPCQPYEPAPHERAILEVKLAGKKQVSLADPERGPVGSVGGPRRPIATEALDQCPALVADKARDEQAWLRVAHSGSK
jgi:hypothetical protein